jgi:NAD(P)H-dependent FMN reductase
MPDPRVLLVVGASRPDHHVDRCADTLEADARTAGADLRRIDLARLDLPVMATGSEEQAALPSVVHVRETAAWAEGFLIVTPEYHGNMSGALKNWFDFLWEELAGKFAGVVAVTGGGGGDMSITAVKTCFQWCHGFTLPFHAACRPGDFDPDGALVGPRVLDRIARIAHDVCRYAPVIASAFAEARARGSSVDAGVAGLHGDEE